MSLNLPSSSTAVQAAPLADQVFNTLHGWIVDGELRPGQRLRVRDLAEAVGTSVMPVREAIRRLVESGLAESEPYKGARVRRLDVDELEHAYDVRILLEGEGARLGALAGDDGLADRMHEHWLELRRYADAGDVGAALAQDELLLEELYAASGNEILVGIIRGLWDKCRPYKVAWATAGPGEGELGIWHYKPELVSAVRARDGDSAAQILRTSYLEAKATIRESLEPA
ncbi:MAG: GntR family transcriptional regulator [Dermatophilus congolensis]|nr:GntR family transcriptional regulator [Dermatophilus congolensis]